MDWRGLWKIAVCFVILTLIAPHVTWAQSVASGTVEGVVTDPTGAVLSNATVVIRNALTGYQQQTTTDDSGTFRFSNLPFNNYRLEVTFVGFSPSQQDINVRTSVPINMKVMLSVSGLSQAVTVEATGEILEEVPFAHSTIDISTLDKLPTFSPASGLSDAIVLSSPGVVADSNGFFHPLGDHAQTSFSIDGQPIGDQQSKAFSTQIPVNAIQSMELVSGTPNAEFGDKTSLVVSATTRSGLGLRKPQGSLLTQYGSFGTVSQEATLAFGSAKAGYFAALNGTRSGRFLDTPEFQPIHDIGNGSSIFNRFDFNPSSRDALHLNLFFARNWFQSPNTYDQPDQDQRQRVITFNIAPGYQRTLSPRALLTINPFIRRDRLNFYPSANALNDTPATLSQDRTLTNYGVRADVAYVSTRHNVKIGLQAMNTRLHEIFSVGITDPTFNMPGTPGFEPGLLAVDLTRGGAPFRFNEKGSIKEYAVYVQDSVTLGKLTFNPGLRIDRYDGITKSTAVEPRIGLSYMLAVTKTVLRAGYARTFETPYNENLLLSSFAGPNGFTDLQKSGQQMEPGRRNQFNIGFQQAFGRFVQVDADYFWKFTRNAYDFDVILNTPLTFPISWDESRLDGFSIRVSTPDLHGFQAYTTMGHTRTRFFPPELGGVLFNSPLADTVFRIDHDQAFQQTSSVRYQWKKHGPWGAFTWRYDSGLVAGAVGSLEDAVGLTAAQQAAIGFFCGADTATISHRIENCTSPNFGATRFRIPEPGTLDNDHNPPRVAPRHVFDVGMGTDNLLSRNEGSRITLRFTISNLANKIALYNFLSTFSGTHFIAPRSYQGAVGFVF